MLSSSPVLCSSADAFQQSPSDCSVSDLVDFTVQGELPRVMVMRPLQSQVDPEWLPAMYVRPICVP
jgi:hypothetical protein